MSNHVNRKKTTCETIFSLNDSRWHRCLWPRYQAFAKFRLVIVAQHRCACFKPLILQLKPVIGPVSKHEWMSEWVSLVGYKYQISYVIDLIVNFSGHLNSTSISPCHIDRRFYSIIQLTPKFVQAFSRPLRKKSFRNKMRKIIVILTVAGLVGVSGKLPWRYFKLLSATLASMSQPNSAKPLSLTTFSWVIEL